MYNILPMFEVQCDLLLSLVPCCSCTKLFYWLHVLGDNLDNNVANEVALCNTVLPSWKIVRLDIGFRGLPDDTKR